MAEKFQVEIAPGEWYEIEAESQAAAIDRLNKSMQRARPSLNRDRAQLAVAENPPLQSAQGQDTAQSAFDTLNWGQQFLVGAGKSVDDLRLGVKGLFTDLSPEEKRRMEVGERGVRGLPAALGQITSDVAMTALPVAGLTRAAQGANRLRQVATPFVTDAIATAGVEGLKAPTEQTSRLERAGMALAGSAIARQGGKVLNAAVRGRAPTAAARELEQMLGINPRALSPGQRYGGGVASREATLAGSALTYQGARQQQAEGLQSFIDGVTRSVAQRLDNPPQLRPGRQGVLDLGKKFDEMYDEFWKNQFDVNPNALLTRFLRVSQEANSTLGAEQQAKLLKVAQREINRLDDLAAEGGGRVEGRFIDGVSKRLREEADKAFDAGETGLSDAFKELRNGVVDVLPEGRREYLANLNRVYADFRPVREATLKAPNGIPTPKQLRQEALKAADRRSVLEGTAPTVRAAELGEDVFKGTNLNAPVPTFERLANAAASVPLSVGRMAYPRSVAAGDTAVQKALAEALRRTDRAGFTAGRVGGSVGASVFTNPY